MERVPYNVAADLALDEEPLEALIDALVAVATSSAEVQYRKTAAEALQSYLVDRIERGIPNEGRPLPAPYVRLGVCEDTHECQGAPAVTVMNGLAVCVDCGAYRTQVEEEMHEEVKETTISTTRPGVRFLSR